MPRSPLNQRQRKIRKLLVQHKGMISCAEIGRQLNVGRTTVWRDMKVIRKHRPMKHEEYDVEAEKQEIDRALAWYESMESNLLDELEENDREIEGRAGLDSQIAYINARLNLLGQLRSLHENKNDFMLKIGYLTEASKTVRFEDFLMRLRDERGVPDRPNPFRVTPPGVEDADGDAD